MFLSKSQAKNSPHICTKQFACSISISMSHWSVLTYFIFTVAQYFPICDKYVPSQIIPRKHIPEQNSMTK